MRVLYIIRDRSSRKVHKRLHRWAVGFIDGQDGFFEAALHDGTEVTRRTWEEFRTLPASRLRHFDAVVFNAKSGLPWRTDPDTTERSLSPLSMPVALFIGNAKPEVIGEDRVLDRFSAIFKREPFSDLDRYAISATNRSKIVPTILANPQHVLSWRFRSRNRTKPLTHPGWQTPKAHDVFFIGTEQPRRSFTRSEIWRAVSGAGLNCVGGLLPNPDLPVDADLITTPLPKPAYHQAMVSSRINLALDGIGPFTFRHLEILSSGSFALSTPSIRDLLLREPLVENRDYVAFDSIDDLIDKIRFYAANDAERDAIARSGRAAYERLYDVAAHGLEIRAALVGH